MVTETKKQSGYWRINPKTGLAEWIEGQFGIVPPEKPEEEEIAPPIVEPVKTEAQIATENVAYREQLAKQYGGAFAPDEFIQALREGKTQQWLEQGSSFYLTSEQSYQLGYPYKILKLQPNQAKTGWEAWTVPEPTAGITPTPTMTAPPVVSPAGVTPTPPTRIIPKGLSTIYPEIFAEYATSGYSPQQRPEMVLDKIYDWMQSDYQGFIDDLFNRVGESEGNRFLKQLGVSEEYILTELDYENQEARVISSIQNIFPGFKDLSEFNDFIDKDFDLFIETMRSGGTSSEKRQIFEQLGYTPAEIDEFFPEGRVIEAPAQPLLMPKLTWLDKVSEITRNPAKLVPFVSSGVEIYTVGKLLKSAKDLEDGKEISQEDLLALKEYVDRSLKDTDWGYKVADVLTQLIPFAGEFIATGGIFSAGKTAVVKGASIALKRLVTRAGAKLLERKLAQFGVEVVGTIAGGTLRTIATGVVRVPALTLEKQLQVTLVGDEESVWISATKSFGQHWVEIVSESTGGMFGALTNPVKGQLIKAGLFKAFIKVNPAKNANDVKRVFERLGYHGVLGEIPEERVADVGHGILYELGLGDQKFSMPSLEQLSIELAAFSIPGLASQAVGNMGAIKPTIKGLVTEERGAIGGILPSAEWAKMSVPDRVKLIQSISAPEAIKVGLTTKQASASWDALTQSQKQILSTKILTPEVKPTGVEVPLAKGGVPVTPEVTKPIDRNIHWRVATKTGEAVVSITKEGKYQFTPAYPLTERKVFDNFEDAITELSKVGDITEVNVATKTSKPFIAIPKAEVGMPEAGYQPTMIEGVTEKEVRPAGKGKIVQISMEEQLKLQQARQAAEEAPEEVREAYEAQAQIEGLKATQETDPVARKRFHVPAATKKGYKEVGFDFFISIKEQEFPEYFTVKQAQIIDPSADWSKYTQKGLKTYNKVPRDAVLDRIASELGYPDIGGADQIANRVNQIRRENQQIKQLQQDIKTQMVERPLSAVPELTTEEITEQFQMMGQPRYNIKQVDTLVAPFAEYVMNPSTITAYELYRASLSQQRSERFNNLKAKLQEVNIQTGDVTEEQATQIIKDTMSGEYWKVMTEYLQYITEELRDAHFAKVAFVLKDYPAEYAGTITALVNALAGNPIPSIRPTPPPGGFKSALWPQGASALDKLQYVFGKGTRHMKALEKMSSEKKTLKDVVEGNYHEIGRVPIPIDQKTADYLRNLPAWAMQQTVGLDVPGPRVHFTYNPTGELGLHVQGQQLQIGEAGYKVYKSSIPEKTSAESLRSVLELDMIDNQVPEDVRNIVLNELDKRGLDAAFDRLGIEMAKSPEAITPTKYKFEAPIEDAFKQPVLKDWPIAEKQTIVRVLKEAGLTAIDIGNFIRANVASLDNSFLRQSKVLASGHPLIGFAGHNASWQAMFSQKHTEAEWQLIVRDPDFAIYDEIRVKSGADPLRVPAFVNEKGTARYRRAEEYGFPGGERFIPKLTAKIPWIKLSERAFVTGTNKIVWGVWKSKLRLAYRMSEKIASGQMKLKVGESFDIIQEMTDHQKFLADAIQRASLGKAQGLAPAISSMFFAARSKLGRFFFPIHLTGLSVQEGQVRFNPRVMQEAWRDFFLMNAFWGGLMFLGDWLGLWDTEDDPRNAEFGSARIGKIRIDPWAGYRQFVVLYARLVTGTGISSVTGAEYEVNKLGALQNFFRTSLAPLPSILLDFWTGRNFLGQVVEITNAKQWLQRIAPFSVSDVWNAYEEEGVKGAAIAIVPAIYGEGVQAYTGDWEDNFTKLGLPEYLENTAYGLNDPRYDLADIWSDTVSQFKGVDPATLTEQKGYPAYVRDMVETKRILEQVETIPSDKLVSLNADPSLEEPTFSEYYQRWKEREKLVTAGDKAVFEDKVLQPDGKYKMITYKGDDAVTAFDKKYPSTHKGNFSQRQFALLNEYWLITDKKKQAEFLEKNKAEIGTNLRDDWLRSHPTENARLALYGKANLLTKEGYNQYKQMLKKFDYPDSAIPELTLPPETSIDTHFTYEEMVSQGKQGSWEAQLLLKKDAIKTKEAGVQSYVDWAKLKLSDTPIASLEIKTKPEYRQIYDKIESFSDKDSPDYIADEKARAEAVKKLKTSNFIDDTRRIEAIEKGTDEAPIDEKLVSTHVEYGKLIDKEGVGSSSAEAMLYRVDNPDYDKFRTNKTIWGDQTLSPIDESRIPVWRIDVKYSKEDAAYNAIKNPLPKEQARLRDAYMTAHPEYRKDSRRREAYGLTNTLTGEKFPTTEIENYVSYNELSVKGFRQERFLVENPDFAKVMRDIKGVDLPDPTKIPAVQYDDIYDQYKDSFDKLDGLGDNESEFYIEDSEQRDLTRKGMRFDTKGKYTEFGLAEVRREGYGKFVPQNQIENYVGYYTKIGEGKPKNYKLNTGTDLWYEDDWYLMEHMDFYRDVYVGLLKNERRDFRKVPTRQVFNLYLSYIKLPHDKAKDDFRLANLDLDAWGVIAFGWKPIEQQKVREKLTAYEKWLEEWAQRGAGIEEKLKELRR